MAKNFDHYIDFVDECCYTEDNCRLQGCGAKVAFGPGCAFEDMANIPWLDFDIPLDLISFDLETTADVETFKRIGSCWDICKLTGTHWNISGSYYKCMEDVAQCRSCTEGNCVSFCYAPCGWGYIYDVADDIPDEPLQGGDGINPGDATGQVNPDIIENGSGVHFGTGVVNNCGESVSPDDYITNTFSITGCGQLYRENMCQSPALAPAEAPLIPGSGPIAPGELAPAIAPAIDTAILNSGFVMPVAAAA